MDLLQALVGNPVDGEFGFVAAGFEDAGSPGGELEHGGTAEAPVGDEEGAALVEFGLGFFLAGVWAWDGEFELGDRDGDACELSEFVLGDIEGEEGGGSGLNFAAEAFGYAVPLGAAAGGEEEAIAAHHFSRPKLHFKLWCVSFNALNSGYSGAGFDADACVGGGKLEGIDDGGGVVGGGEHAAVSFGFEGDAAIVEPADGVAGLEAGEGASEGFAAAGVVLNQFAGVEAAVGDVAAATAGDADFGEDLLGGFEDGDAEVGVGFGDRDRAKEPGSTAANDDYVGGAGHIVRSKSRCSNSLTYRGERVGAELKLIASLRLVGAFFSALLVALLDALLGTPPLLLGAIRWAWRGCWAASLRWGGFDNDGLTGGGHELGDDEAGGLASLVEDALLAGCDDDFVEGGLAGDGLQFDGGIGAEVEKAAIVVVDAGAVDVDFLVEDLGGGQGDGELVALRSEVLGDVAGAELAEVDASADFAVGNVEKGCRTNCQVAEGAFSAAGDDGFHVEDGGGEFADVADLLDDDGADVNFGFGLGGVEDFFDVGDEGFACAEEADAEEAG